MKMEIRQSVINTIKHEPLLFGEVANELGLTPSSMHRVLYANDKRLTQAGVMAIIKRHTGLNDEEIIEKPAAVNTAS
jgi:hypothetical protein